MEALADPAPRLTRPPAHDSQGRPWMQHGHPFIAASCPPQLWARSRASVALTSCGHVFHGVCLLNWETTCATEGSLPQCPSCRSSYATMPLRGGEEGGAGAGGAVGAFSDEESDDEEKGEEGGGDGEEEEDEEEDDDGEDDDGEEDEEDGEEARPFLQTLGNLRARPGVPPPRSSRALRRRCMQTA